MLTYYSAIVVIALAICIIMCAAVHDSTVIGRREKRLFWTLFCAAGTAVLCEWSAVMLDGQGLVAHTFIPMLKLVEFSLTPALPIMYAATLEPYGSHRIKVASDAVLAHAALELAATPLGLVFSVDATGTYHHGGLYGLYIAAYLVSMVFLLLETRRFAGDLQYRGRRQPWLIHLMLAGGVVLQMVFDVRVVWLSVAIGGVLFYVFYTSVTTQVDSLTQLLNRMCYEGSMAALRDRSLFILIDVDRFKHVNDEYGHTAGDRALEAIGRAIHQVYAKYGMCFRYGGDEFFVILTEDLDRIEAFNRELCRLLDVARLELPYLPTVSIGFAEYDPRRTSKEKVIAAADEMMYRWKKSRRTAAE